MLAFFSLNKEGSSVKKFYIRRILSIVPAYYFFILIYWLLSFLGCGWSQTDSKVSILINFLMIHGIFVQGSNDVVPGGWYIGVLAVFYALAPFLCRIVTSIYKRLYKILIPLYCLSVHANGVG